mgnify:FL=1
MDIDEFLDRETSELGLAAEKVEKSETITTEKENLEPSTLFESINAFLIKGNLEEAEQAFVQLWHLLLEQKLKWNKELYEQLLSLTRQFSSILNRAYVEVKRKADYVYQLLNKARTAIREGKKDVPFKIYAEVQEINNSIPNTFFEEKRIIQEQITDFYKELRNTTDNELLKRVSSLIQELEHLILRIENSIRSNDTVNAIVNYNKCIELYNQVPEGFLRHKTSIGMRILEIYKILSIFTEISNLQKALGSDKSQMSASMHHTQLSNALKTQILQFEEKPKGSE